MPEMISVEDARNLVLSNVSALEAERVGVLDAAGRIAAKDVISDSNIAPFAHSAMDGFAVRADQIASATEDAPVTLRVVAEIAAGDTYEGEIAAGECVRIMTGAPLPNEADSVVKYEIVRTVSGDGRTGSQVAFTRPTSYRSNVREAGEEAREGEIIVHCGELINAAGVGFLAGCGATEVQVYRRPKVAIISIGSELVEPSEKPSAGKIRNSNGYALAAAARSAGAIPEIMPLVKDSMEDLCCAVKDATKRFDFVVTSGGASNGDYDFIKPVVEELGSLLMTLVDMRPGKAQTFGIVQGVPVFGLPGNPAAAYVGFEMLVRPALRKMQGYTCFERPSVMARLSSETKKRDTRRIYLRSTLTKNEDGEYLVTPAKNQSSGLFGPLQKSNAFVVLPEGEQAIEAGSFVPCILLDVSEDTLL